MPGREESRGQSGTSSLEFCHPAEQGWDLKLKKLNLNKNV